jgi:hypothetical protein
MATFFIFVASLQTASAFHLSAKTVPLLPQRARRVGGLALNRYVLLLRSKPLVPSTYRQKPFRSCRSGLGAWSALNSASAPKKAHYFRLDVPCWPPFRKIDHLVNFFADPTPYAAFVANKRRNAIRPSGHRTVEALF